MEDMEAPSYVGLSKRNNITAILNSLSYFKPFTSNVFLRNNEAYKLLYFERKIIYLSTTYVKFTCPNSDCLMAHED